MLPSEIRSFAADGQPASAVSRGAVLVVQQNRVGAPVRFDGRFRLVLPAWLSHLGRSDGSVLLTTRWPEPSSALFVAPTSLLDQLFDVIAREYG